jgi:hypothetical protein
LNAYAELERLARVSISGLPADLVARRAKAALLAELDRSEERVLVAGALDADLQASRWILDRGTFEAYSAQVDRWLGVPTRERTDREAVAAAVDCVGRVLWDRSAAGRCRCTSWRSR